MYDCNHCGWRGTSLAYVGFTGLAASPLPGNAERLYGRGQGVCPTCGVAFQGCVHPRVMDEMRERDMDDYAGPVCYETPMMRHEQCGDDGRESYFYECVQCGYCTDEFLVLESETDYDD